MPRRGSFLWPAHLVGERGWSRRRRRRRLPERRRLGERKWLVGWQWHDPEITGCIVSCVGGQDIEEVTARLAKVQGEHLAFASHPLQVLGSLDDDDDGEGLACARDGWLTVALDKDNLPRCETASFILYDPPDGAQYRLLSLTPLELAEITVLRRAVLTEGEAGQRAAERSSHVFTAWSAPRCRYSSGLETALAYANQARLVERALSPERHAKRSGAGEKALDGLAKLFSGVNSFFIALADLLCPVLNYTLFDVQKKRYSLCTLSVLCRQIDHRLQMAQRMPGDIERLRAGTAQGRAAYVNFYNSLWLILNDFIIGRTLATLICANAEAIADRSWTLAYELGVEGVRQTVFWLNSWPAGLKLNNELGQFLASLFVFMAYIAEDALLYARPYAATIIFSFGLSGFIGASFLLSAMVDLVSLASLHLWIFYTMMVRLYSWQLDIIKSLFQIFRGKRRNVLRDRVDSCHYDLDQLLLSTILSVLMVFLFPTVLVYYIASATARIIQVAFFGTVETGLIFLNQLPLFPLLLTIKDPERLPFGIRLVHTAQTASREHSTSPLRLESLPITRWTILKAFFSSWHQRSLAYTPSLVTTSLLQGKTIGLRHGHGSH